jgi:hypothetical protein
MSDIFAIGSLVSVGALGIYLYQTNSEEDSEDKVKDEAKVEDESPKLEDDKKTKTRTNRMRQRGITRKRY